MDDTAVSVAPPPQKPTPPARRSPLPWLLGIAALAGGSAFAFYTYGPKGGQKSAAAHGEGESEGRKADAGMPVEVAHPRQGGVTRSTTQAGSVHAFDHASLYSKVSGYLKELSLDVQSGKQQPIDIGSRVKRDQLLAVLEVPELDTAVQQHQASLDKARALVGVAEAKVRSARAAKEAAQALVKQAETMVSAKKSNQELQRKQLARIQGLVQRNAVDQKLQDEQQDRFDVSVADVGVAQAEVLANQAQVLSKEALVEEAQADLKESQANVEVAQSNLEMAKVMQSYTRITSPYDGVVTFRGFHRGDFIRSASDGGNVPVLSVARTDLMRVVLPIPDVDVPFANEGDKAVLSIVALPGRTFSGTISRFSESEDSASRNMRTEVDLPNPDGKLREGMFGKVTVTLQNPSPNSVTIPSTALIGQNGTGEGSVYVVKDDTARKVKVHVGNDNGAEVEVLSGLSADDVVIVSYNGPIDDGTKVKPEMKKGAKSGL